MNSIPRLLCDRFPKSNKYNPEWMIANASGGANSLWLTEWLTDDMELKPGMRVLDLSCGRASSSIFLHREFGVDVWATDLWFSPAENQQRIADAGYSKNIFPIHANARSLPFSTEFFDAIISIDSFFYYGTDDLYLPYIARFLKVGGQIGIAGVGLMQDFAGAVPQHLEKWWGADNWCLHSAGWWRRHWERTGILDIQLADNMPEGWLRWLEWQQAIAPNNTVEMEALKYDRGNYLGYARAIGRRTDRVTLEDPIVSIPSHYTSKPLLRTPS